MPGVAHQVANSAITFGKNKVDECKKAGGYTKYVVETVEKPVNYTLETRVGQTALKVGDYGLTIADRTIDAAMPTVKAAENIVKPVTTTVSNTTKAITNTVSRTTTAVVTPVANAYTGVITVADDVVNKVMPEPAEQKLSPVTVVGVGVKVGRRVRVRVGRAATRTRKAGAYCVERTKAGVSFAIEQARPSNIKKNVVSAYELSLKSLDGFVDQYLPDEDGEVARGPVSLGKKVVKRTYKKSLAAVKYAATAIKNSPTTFKNAYKTVSAKASKLLMDTTAAMKARAQALASMRVRVRVLTYKDIEPYLQQAQTRSLQAVQATDDLLLRFRLTALLRNFAVDRYQLNVAPIVNRIAAPKAQTPAPEPAAKKPAAAKAAPVVVAAEAEKTPATASAAPPPPAAAMEPADELMKRLNLISESIGAEPQPQRSLSPVSDASDGDAAPAAGAGVTEKKKKKKKKAKSASGDGLGTAVC